MTRPAWHAKMRAPQGHKHCPQEFFAVLGSATDAKPVCGNCATRSMKNLRGKAIRARDEPCVRHPEPACPNLSGERLEDQFGSDGDRVTQRAVHRTAVGINTVYSFGSRPVLFIRFEH